MPILLYPVGSIRNPSPVPQGCGAKLWYLLTNVNERNRQTLKLHSRRVVKGLKFIILDSQSISSIPTAKHNLSNQLLNEKNPWKPVLT